MRKGCPWALAHKGHSLYAFIGRQTVCGRCEALYACRLVTSRGTRSVPQRAKPFVKTREAVLSSSLEKDCLFCFHIPEKEGFEPDSPSEKPVERRASASLILKCNRNVTGKRRPSYDGPRSFISLSILHIGNAGIAES